MPLEPTRHAFMTPLRRLVCAVLVFLPAVVQATSFSVTPTRITLAPGEKTTTVTLVNQDKKPVLLQAETYDWFANDKGDEQLTPSEDLLLTPPIIRIKPGERQVVRLAVLSAPDATRQRTFRLIVREVPPEPIPGQNISLPITLAISLPVFITPPQVSPKPSCAVSGRTPDSLKKVKVLCSNTGTATIQVRTMQLKASGKLLAISQSAGYLLPGSRREFLLEAPSTAVDKTPNSLPKPDPKLPVKAKGPAELLVSYDDSTDGRFSVNLSE